VARHDAKRDARFSADCLMALAQTANLPGYSKPELTGDHQLICEGAFHPMVAALSNDFYVPVRTGLGSCAALLALNRLRRPTERRHAKRDSWPDEGHHRTQHGRQEFDGPSERSPFSLCRAPTERIASFCRSARLR
jgi:hypothetical protein